MIRRGTPNIRETRAVRTDDHMLATRCDACQEVIPRFADHRVVEVTWDPDDDCEGEAVYHAHFGACEVKLRDWIRS